MPLGVQVENYLKQSRRRRHVEHGYHNHFVNVCALSATVPVLRQNNHATSLAVLRRLLHQEHESDISMRLLLAFFSLFIISELTHTTVVEADDSEKLLLQDDFEREESDPKKEEVGNGWGTNSRTRAKGQKQVDLVDGAMHVTRAAVADHGVSVHHEVAFRNATIQLRFKLGPQDDLGINIADMKEKSVHAGHICVARIRLNKVEITDLKTGRMNLERRKRRLEDKLTEADKKINAETSRSFKTKLAPNKWHDLSVKISGETMTVAIDGNAVGEFTSPGIGHSTKSRLRLAVNKSAWIDDVSIHGE